MKKTRLTIYCFIIAIVVLSIYFQADLLRIIPIKQILISENDKEDLNNELGKGKTNKIKKPRTLAEAVNEYSQRVEKVLKPEFENIGLPYPPKNIALLFFKQEKKMELWSMNEKKWKFVKVYPIKAASGIAGPKLKEGDFQVPEGIYEIELLNPNSNYHLSMKINYPNEFDLEQAKLDGRVNLGGDIYIHGNALSAGCLAMGDDASEQLFVIASQVGIKNIQVIISPNDTRPKSLNSKGISQPIWLSKLYLEISEELKKFTIK